MNSFDEIKIFEQLQRKIKKGKYVVLAVIVYVLFVVAIIICSGLEIIVLPKAPDNPAITIGILVVLAFPVCICVNFASKCEKGKQQYMNEYNKMFYLKAFSNVEGVEVIDVVDYGIDANNYEMYDSSRTYVAGDRTTIDYYRQSVISVSAKINDMNLKFDNYIMWRLSRGDYAFSRKNGIKRKKYGAKDGELVGEITNSTKLVYRFSISHNDYKNQVSLKDMSHYPTVSFGVKELDKNYIINTMDDTKTKKLISDKVIELMEKVNRFNMPIYIYMEGDKIEFRIKSNNIKQYPSLSKIIDYNEEMTRAVFIVNTFYELFMELNKHT